MLNRLKNLFASKKKQFSENAENQKNPYTYQDVLHYNLENARRAVEFGIKELNPADSYGKVDKNVHYVYWGEDNLLPHHILQASALNNIISSIAEAYKEILVGEGYHVNTMLAEQYLQSINAEKIIDKIAWDLVIFDAFACEITSEVRDTRFVPVNVDHVPFSRIRFDKKNLNGKKHAYYSAIDWSLIDYRGQVKNLYNLTEEERELYAVKVHFPYLDSRNKVTGANPALYVDYEYHPSNDYYPKSDIQTVTGFSLINEQAQEYHVNYFKNGIMGSIVVNIPFDPKTITNEKELNAMKNAVLAEAKARWQGAQKAGQPFFNLYEVDGDGQTILPKAEISGFPGDQNDRKYIEMFQAVGEQIFMGMGVVEPSAFGLKSNSGALGKAEVMSMAYEQAEKFRIKNKRKMIEKFFNLLLTRAGIEDTFTLPYVPPVKPTIEVKQVVEYLPVADNNNGNEKGGVK